MDKAALARLEAVVAQHARAQGVNPRDHGVVAVADLRALRAAYDALLAERARAAPVLAACEQWIRGRLAADPKAWDRADNALVQAYAAWRAAREG